MPVGEHSLAVARPFVLSNHSLTQLVGVHPDLVAVVTRAIRLSTQDFRVTDGIRTPAEQRKLVEAGKSWTMRSRHLVQPDGFGHAVDLVPWLAGKLSWEWPLCYQVAAAMSDAARDAGIQLRWGGVWDRPMDACGQISNELKNAVDSYVARRRKAGLRAAIDGPHFELL
jgi:peptidoglycan L-alanyl-D-glutamate endopeptidase CwlK